VTSGTGIASVHDSGGERAMFVDLAHDLGVPLAAISDDTRNAIQATLDPGLVAANPLDAWGTGIDADRIFRESLQLLHDDPETAAVAFAVDLTRQGEPYDEGYLQIARDLFEKTSKPFCLLSNLASAVASEEAAMLREAGIPVLEGTASGLRALGHLLADREHRERPPIEHRVPVDAAVRGSWRSILSKADGSAETASLRLLADYGIPVVRAEAAGDFDGAAAAADEVGYPVALKTANPEISHKSDVDGVRLGIADVEELRLAYAEMSSRLSPLVTVAAMAPAGVELALGIVRDPQFGPLVLVAAGGVLIELLHDRVLGLPPIDERGARAMIDRLATRPLLDGLRSQPAADVGALARALSRLSVLAMDVGDLLDALDVNPIIVSHDGCVAVDALVVPRVPGG
jgi:acyl-CoA synthetase (NDP forming)